MAVVLLLGCLVVLLQPCMGEDEMEPIVFDGLADVKFDAEPLQEGLPPKLWNLKQHGKMTTSKFSNAADGEDMFEKKAEVFMLERVLEPDEVSSILSAIGDKEFSKAGDYVDDLPSNMIRIGPAACREFCPDEDLRQKLIEITAPIIQTRLLPFLRHRYNCDNCTVCNIAFRRYAAGELGQRSQIKTHYDEGYFASASVGLDVQGLEYDGGLYIEDDGEKKVVPLKTGDAFFHQYDLAHGVDVLEGRRLSMVLNFQDSADCVPDHGKWYRKAAKKGDPVAQFQLGQLYQVGTPKTVRNITKARTLLQQAVDHGYPRAALALADAFRSGHAEAQADQERALEVLRGAASGEIEDAVFALGRYHLESPGGDRAEGLRLLKQAAEPPMSMPIAQQTLGNVYLGGDAAAEDMTEAVKWWRIAGDNGVPSAMGNVGAFHLNEVLDGMDKKTPKQNLQKTADEAERWLRPAAASGFGPAMYSLGVLELKFHNRVEDALVWLEKAKDAGHEQAKEEFDAVRALRVQADEKKAKTKASYTLNEEL